MTRHLSILFLLAGCSGAIDDTHVGEAPAGLVANLPKLPTAEHTFFGASTRDGRFTSFSVETGTAPQQSFIYDWKDKKLATWHKPSAPETDVTRPKMSAVVRTPSAPSRARASTRYWASTSGLLSVPAPGNTCGGSVLNGSGKRM